MRTLYIECNMGAAGDMLMAALYELLDDKEGFLNVMNHLGLPGVRLEAQPGSSCGIAGTHMQVTVHGEEEKEPAAAGCGQEHNHGNSVHTEQHHGHCHEQDHGHDHGDHHGENHKHDAGTQAPHGYHHHASPGHIARLIDGLELPEEVKRHARAVYDAIAEAEAKAHGCPVGDVHFHEVGALDAVADVTGVCYAMYLLQPERVVVSPVHVGSGTVRCAHGVMPVPAPATAALLTGVPVYGGNIQGELCTPTGAALLVHFADSFGPMPAMISHSVGIGTGTKTFEQANCVRCFLGNIQAEKNGEITELVCNIDDMTPEALSFACSRLLELGALDVYTVPGTMKKGRPGHVLTVLCPPDQEEVFACHILAQTTTNGLRARRCAKYFLTPGTERVQTPWGEVRIKKAEGFGVTHRKPEYEDVAELARKHQTSCQKMTEMILSALEKEEPIS